MGGAGSGATDWLGTSDLQKPLVLRFTALSIIRLRQDHSLPSHRDRLRERGLLTVAETAKRLAEDHRVGLGE